VDQQVRQIVAYGMARRAATERADGFLKFHRRDKPDPNTIVTDEEIEKYALNELMYAGQEHLLEGLDGQSRLRLFKQVVQLDRAYSGGLERYCYNAKKLLWSAQRGENPLEGYSPSVPVGERLHYADDLFRYYEDRGLEEAGASVFVLVAGGLGERLGYPGIKVAISSSMVTGWSYLEYFCRHIRVIQQRRQNTALSVLKGPIPFVIMTSDDTHEPTEAMLKENNYFGLLPEQVHVLKQAKVACFTNSQGRLARDPADRVLIETKPHGHGDVHALLHRTKLAERFMNEGLRWLVFFQDTNALFFRAVMATLGVSAEKHYAMNSVSVPRKAEDAMGGIAKLTRRNGTSITMNVEYNQLDPLLRATRGGRGDVADETGFSPFPGNMNSLVLEMNNYVATLKRTNGIIAEFVNPKYKSNSKSEFKSSTRLECMMQDIPREFPAKAEVGFTMFDSWVCYSPVKNSPESALQKFKSGNHPQCGTTGEIDLFAANCKIFRLAGAIVSAPDNRKFNGINVELEARILWSPSWAVTFNEVCHRLPQARAVHISSRSTLILDGDITIDHLRLDGALTIEAVDGVKVVVRNLYVMNAGWPIEDAKDDETDPEVKIKGFRVVRTPGAALRLRFTRPGIYEVEMPESQGELPTAEELRVLEREAFALVVFEGEGTKVKVDLKKFHVPEPPLAAHL